MEKKIVSIIIPIFNTKNYISRCLESVITQTYPHWEAICVDDGSTDGTEKILDEIAAKDSRIKVHHTKNEGVSVARNVGIKIAEGDFVIYLDSDDFLHPQTLEICVKIAEENDVDLVAYTYDRSFRRNEMLRQFFKRNEKKNRKFPHYNISNLSYIVTDDIYKYATEYSKPKMPKEDLKWAVKPCQPWRCLYRMNIVKSLLFIPGIVYEDLPWWGEVLLKVKKTAILNLPLYYYYPNKWSYLISSKQQFKIKSLEIAIDAAVDLYSSRANDYQKEMWENNFIAPFRKKLTNLINYNRT